MMDRRKFLKSISSGLAAISLPNLDQVGASNHLVQLGRVALESLSVYSQPSENSRILFQRFLNDVLHIYDVVISEDGPGYNPYWYKVWGGFVHSGYVPIVENRLNPINHEFPSSGQLMELTVPYSPSYRIRNNGNFEPSYTLFYGSTHWVFDLIEGPLGHYYYEIHNSLVTFSYYVRAEHLRKVEQSELSPIHSEISPQNKRIEIPIGPQKLLAFENDQLIREFSVSTGVPSPNLDPNLIPTDTPKGNHRVEEKRESVHMGEGTPRSDADAYELPGVPWVTYIELNTGVAIHGAYWHSNFGTVMSHGCINMRPEDAKWIYRWSTPYPDGSSSDYHTPVLVY